MTDQKKVNVNISYESDDNKGGELSRLAAAGVEFAASVYRGVTIKHGAYIIPIEQVVTEFIRDKEIVSPTFNPIDKSLSYLAYQFEKAATNESVVTFKPLQNGMNKATLWKFDEETKTYSTKSAICDGYKVISPNGFVPDNQP